MKILGADIALPSGTGHASALASAYAVKAAKLALSQARCLPSELDLIVSLSVSPNRVADSVSIAGPRLAHPVQRDLRASNAHVFDLLDADWTFALDIAQSHSRALGYRRALVVRAEALDDVEGIERGGLSSGAGAIVFTIDAAKPTRTAYARLDVAPLAKLGTAGPGDKRYLARIDGQFDSAAGRFSAMPRNAGAAAERVIGHVLGEPAATPGTLFRESWLASWLPFASWSQGEHRMTVADADATVPAPYQFPAWLAQRKADRRQAAAGSSIDVALTLDIFKSRLAAIALEV